MSKSVVRDKSFSFAVRIVKFARILQDAEREYVLSKQIIRSGTAIGALVREAEQSESKLDFIHKLSIALKEATETDYWIDLLFQTDYLNAPSAKSLKADVDELIRLLTSIIKTSKKSLN